jgi:hypothetical protein
MDALTIGHSMDFLGPCSRVVNPLRTRDGEHRSDGLLSQKSSSVKLALGAVKTDRLDVGANEGNHAIRLRTKFESLTVPGPSAKRSGGRSRLTMICSGHRLVNT